MHEEKWKHLKQLKGEKKSFLLISEELERGTISLSLNRFLFFVNCIEMTGNQAIPSQAADLADMTNPFKRFQLNFDFAGTSIISCQVDQDANLNVERSLLHV